MRPSNLTLFFLSLYAASSSHAYDAELFHQLLRAGEPALALALIDSPQERGKTRKRIDHLRMARAQHANGMCEEAMQSISQARILSQGNAKDPEYALLIEKDCKTKHFPAASLTTSIPRSASVLPVTEEPPVTPKMPASAAVVATPPEPASLQKEILGSSPSREIVLPQQEPRRLVPPKKASAFDLGEAFPWAAGISIMMLLLVAVASRWYILRKQTAMRRVREEVNSNFFMALESFPAKPAYEDPIVTMSLEAARANAGA